MDRRCEPRVETYQSVQITVLGDESPQNANVIQLSGQGMRIVLDRPVPVNAAVKVTGDDWLVLGEVCYCRREHSHYAAGLRLDQVLTGLHELAEQNLRLTGGTGIPACVGFELTEKPRPEGSVTPDLLVTEPRP